ncbi:putative Mobilization protein MobB [Pseudomonas amygdali pv. morsprunorum]|nr:putative Mobilization protein MobB [Pseudomonas amygdali pv. morsprunorum]
MSQSMSKSTARQATVRIEIRCTEEDAALIREKALAAEISVADLMRRAALNRKIKTPTDKKLMASLLQLGGLQKHLFNQMQDSMTTDLSKQFSDVLVAIRNAVNAIDLSQTRIK